MVNNMAETKSKIWSNTVVPTNTWTGLEIAAIAAGVDVNARVGNKIHLKGVRMKYHFAAGGTTGQVYNFRLIVANNLNDTGVTAWPVGLLALASPEDNKVFKDKIYTCVHSGTAGVYTKESHTTVQDIWIPLNFDYEYTGSAVGDNADFNSLVVGWLTDLPTGDPGLQYYIELFYNDI